MAVTSCGNYSEKKAYTSGSTTIAVDATFLNVIQQEIGVFEYRYPNTSILDRDTTESGAIDLLLDGTVKMALTTRELDKKEIAFLRNTKKLPVSQQAIAIDAIALIVNPENPLKEIDYEDIKAILGGEIKSWDKIVPGAPKLGNISVVYDGNGSSTIRYMRDSVLDGRNLDLEVNGAVKSPDEVFKRVASDRNSIGVIGVSWITSNMKGREMTKEEFSKHLDSDQDTTVTDFNPDIRVLAVKPKGKLRAYLPYQLNIYNGDYPFTRNVYLISTSVPHTVGHSFYSFVTSAVGQKIILTTGVCPKLINAQFVSLE